MTPVMAAAGGDGANTLGNAYAVPHCPNRLEPQHIRVCVVRTAHVWALPVDTAATSVNHGMGVGFDTLGPLTPH